MAMAGVLISFTCCLKPCLGSNPLREKLLAVSSKHFFSFCLPIEELASLIPLGSRYSTQSSGVEPERPCAATHGICNITLPALSADWPTTMEKGMFSFLKVIATTGGGFAALGAAMFYSMYAGWFKSELLNGLPSESLYKLFLYSLGSCVICFVLLIILQAFSRKPSISATADNSSTTVVSTGSGAVTVHKP